jgi:hypothetical protein
MGYVESRWYQVGRRLCSISAYELQLIDDKIRDAGIIEYAGKQLSTLCVEAQVSASIGSPRRSATANNKADLYTEQTRSWSSSLLCYCNYHIYPDLLGVKDPAELIKVAELRREAIK